MAAEKSSSDNKGAVGCVALVLLGAAWLYGRCGSDEPNDPNEHRTPEKIAEDTDRAKKAAQPAPVPIVEKTCSISIPGTTRRVPVFPTKDGMGEFAGAASRGDDAAMQAALVGNRGYLVPTQTKCTWIDVGLLGSTNVRITEGDHLGASVWVPTEWASGKE